MNDKSFDHDSDIHLLAGAYALDAVDDLERARFEQHLRTCDDCQHEVRELAETAALVGAADALATPPVGMRDAVLAEISQTPQVLPRTHLTDVNEGTDTISRSRPNRAARWLSVAAAVLAVGALGAGTYGLQQHQQSEVLTAQAEMVTSVLMAPDAQLHQMPMGSASSAIVMSPSEGSAVMVAANVPTLPGNQVYELWTLTTDGKARPAGVWTPSSNGSAAVPIKGDLATTAGIAVTVEPPGGSAQPTSKPIASATMT